MTKSTLRVLERIASRVSNENRRVSPMQVAAVLLEEAVNGTYDTQD